MNAALAELVAAEERGRLWQQRVLGYPLWPLLRLERYRAALLSGETAIAADVDPRGRSLPTRLGHAAVEVMRQGLPRHEGRDGRDIWVLSSSTYRRRDAQGDYPCIFAEHLRQQLGPRLRFIEMNAANLPLAGRPEVFLLDGYLRYIHGVATLASRTLRASVISEDVRRAFAPTAPAELIRRAVYGRLLQQLTAGLLRVDRPKCVFVLCAYGSTIPMQRAIHAAGVPMIELQHGVIHESHPGYVFSEQVPKLDHRPDHLLLFGKHFGELLDRASPGLHTPWTVGGHPWLRRAATRALSASVDDADKPPLVVIFGQYDPPVQAQLRTLVPQLRQLLPDSVQLIYKPHPREPMAAMRAAMELPGLSIADGAEDAYRLLARCTASVTVYSTLAIEALAFPCRSIVLRSPFWNEDIRSYVEQGVLQAAEDVADLAKLVQPSQQVRSELADRLFGVSTPEPDFAQLIEQVARR